MGRVEYFQRCIYNEGGSVYFGAKQEIFIKLAETLVLSID